MAAQKRKNRVKFAALDKRARLSVVKSRHPLAAEAEAAVGEASIRGL